jgi:hypothetical protein
VNHYELVRDASALAWKLPEDGTPAFSDFFPDLSDEDLARLWLTVEHWSKAVSEVKELVGDEWVSRGASVEVDGYLVYTKKAYTKETCVDTETFLDWLASETSLDDRVLHRLINPNNIRKGSLPSSVRSTFFEKEDVVKPEFAQAVPIDVLEQAKTKKEISQ